jgi:hypothetical protein
VMHGRRLLTVLSAAIAWPGHAGAICSHLRSTSPANLFSYRKVIRSLRLRRMLRESSRRAISEAAKPL